MEDNFIKPGQEYRYSTEIHSLSLIAGTLAGCLADLRALSFDT